MRWIVLGAAGCLLVGCTDKAQEAEKRLAIVERVGSLGEVCEASKEVARAYLEQGDERDYELADVTSDIKCDLARLKGWNMPAQDDRREQTEAEVDAMANAMEEAAEGTAANTAAGN